MLVKYMKNTLTAAAFLLACSLVGAAETTLAAAAPGDLVPAKLIGDRSLVPDPPASHDKVSLSWALDREAPPIAAAPVHVAASRGYWQRIAATDLVEGLELPVTASGALVRISPTTPGTGLDPRDLVLVNGAGQVFEGGSGVQALVSPDQMRAAGQSGVAPDTAVFRLGEDLGTGNILLYGNKPGRNDYVIDVLERGSDLELLVRTGQDTYLWGQTLTVSTELRDGGRLIQPASLSGTIIDPDGRSYPLVFARGATNAALRLPEAGGGPGLWQVQISAGGTSGKNLFRRTARTAFAVSQPTARFSGKVATDGTSATLGLEVAVAGRYEVRALLYGTDETGSLQPLAVGNSAAWLEPGAAVASLEFDSELVADSGLNAPFVVRDLRLFHQNRMSLLHRQDTAFTLAAK